MHLMAVRNMGKCLQHDRNCKWNRNGFRHAKTGLKNGFAIDQDNIFIDIQYNLANVDT